MIGIVEIYSGFGTNDQKLLHTEQNLIVDGAGEAIVDLLMTPSSIVSSVSGMNDTSNYTVQAISFGKAASAYTQYGHYWAPTAGDHFGTSSLITRIQDDQIMRVMEMSSTWNHGDDLQLLASSYAAPARDRLKNSFPNPVDTVLEAGTDTAIDLSGGEFHYDESGKLVAGKYTPVGHNMNVTQFDSAASSIFRGCWPLSGTGSSAIIVSSQTYGHMDDVAGHGAAIYPNPQDAGQVSSIHYGGSVYGGPLGGGYNNAQAMDMSGYVKAYNLCLGELSGIKKEPGVQTLGSLSGLLVSAQEGTDTLPAFAVPGDTDLTHIVGKTTPLENCEVIYVTTLASGDVGYSNLFGGITTLGLWTIDLEKTLDGLSATAHTETDNLLYYADGSTASGDPYQFQNTYGWVKTNLGITADPVSGNQRDPYGGHAWQAIAGAGEASTVAKVAIPTLTASGDYTFSVYFQGYQNPGALYGSSIGLHMTAMTSATDLHYGFPTSGGAALGQRGSLSSLTGSIQDDDLNNWTRVSHTAKFPDGTSAINCQIVLSSLGWGVPSGVFYESGKYVAVAHAKLEEGSTATDFVAGRNEYPPFRFKAENNPLRYKLFAKRTLTDNLAKISDKSITEPGAIGYQDLTLVWRIKFA